MQLDGVAETRVRVVSLNCSNTEIVAALGCSGLLVGVDDDSDFPAGVVAKLPHVGRDLDIDVAKVAALAPDLVLASNTVPGHEKVIAALHAANLPCYAPETITLADVAHDIREIARRLGVAARGEAVAGELEGAVAAAREAIEVTEAAIDATNASTAAGSAGSASSATAAIRRPRVLLEWWPKPVIVPGRLSWVTELIEAAGGVNPFGHDDVSRDKVKSRPVRDEEVVAADPDAVVICWCGVKPEKYRPEVVTGRAAWAATGALRRGQVHCVPEAFLGRPGPRLVDGLRALQRVVASARAARDGTAAPPAVR
ncbi:MAG: cobalamin-binding protein [Planctomycetes bacterium]|nr:cobalamin-binding protein [Planctomycetota bacterium]